MPQALSGLYLITDPSWGEHLTHKVEGALRGGCRLVQYRNKHASAHQAEIESRELLALCQRYNTPLLINDNLDLAIHINADGVHLGQGDDDCAGARELLAPNKIIGVTCHDQLTLALQAQKDGADYVAFGRFFDSETKPEAGQAPLSLITEAKRRLRAPVVAIGGITLDNAPSIINLGADMLAVSHSLLSAEDCDQQARAFAHCFSFNIRQNTAHDWRNQYSKEPS